MRITKQHFMNMCEALLTIAEDMSQEDKQAINFEELKQAQRLPFSEVDKLEGMHIPTLEEQKQTLAELFIAISKK